MILKERRDGGAANASREFDELKARALSVAAAPALSGHPELHLARSAHGEGCHADGAAAAAAAADSGIRLSGQ